MPKISLMGRAGMKIRAGDGGEEMGFPEMMSTPLFYQASPGDRLTLLDSAYKFNVATYRPEIEPRWMYTYAYAPDQSWTVYNRDLSGGSYRQEDYLFRERVYFRLCLRKTDGGSFDGTEDINGIILFDAVAPPKGETKPWLKAEAERVARRVNEIRKPGELAFALLTDSHYTVNGTWDDTIAGIRAVHEAVGFDGIIHLGDLTDGMVTAEVTRYYVKNILNDLKSCGVPVWIALGNHDSNYFKNNAEPFSIKEQCELYLGREEPRYCVDFEKQGLRLIFLDSFDKNEKLRYGYSPECLGWLSRMLDETPGGWRMIVFSHLPPVSRLQYWAKEIRGDAEMTVLLNVHAGKILAFVNGHNHADRLDNEAVPIISAANAKCEAFTERKPEGFMTPERRLNDASQELWDVMLADTQRGTLRFVRYGAGRDSLITGGKAMYT